MNDQLICCIANSRPLDLAASSRAARSLFEHLRESESVLGVRIEGSCAIEDLRSGQVHLGHRLNLDTKGCLLPEAARTNIERYVTALSLWQNVEGRVRWDSTPATVEFLAGHEPLPQRTPGFRARLRAALRPRTEKALAALGLLFVENGFKVRDPFPAKLTMQECEYSGAAIMLRYPFNRDTDEAGIASAYDRLLPLIADSYAREYKLKAEVDRIGALATVFFTCNRKYLPSLYSFRPAIRIVSPRPRVWTPIEVSWVFSGSHRACRKLFAQYKKDFEIVKRPLPAVGARGHTVVLHYRKGAGGKVVDESYFLTISRMVEKLKTRYGLQAAVRHNSDSKSIFVTFYSGKEVEFKTGRAYAA